MITQTHHLQLIFQTQPNQPDKHQPKMKFFAILPFAGLALASPVVKRQYAGEDTQNQLKDGTPCRDYTIIFARGTTEDGNVGSLTGPPFFQAVAERVGSNNLAVQGVRIAVLIRCSFCEDCRCPLLTLVHAGRISS